MFNSACMFNSTLLQLPQRSFADRMQILALYRSRKNFSIHPSIADEGLDAGIRRLR